MDRRWTHRVFRLKASLWLSLLYSYSFTAPGKEEERKGFSWCSIRRTKTQFGFRNRLKLHLLLLFRPVVNEKRKEGLPLEIEKGLLRLILSWLNLEKNFAFPVVPFFFPGPPEFHRLLPQSQRFLDARRVLLSHRPRHNQDTERHLPGGLWTTRLWGHYRQVSGILVWE